MPSPFPGMNPYLEQPIFWSEFHSRLIVAIADALAPSLLPKYYIGVETRTYLNSSVEVRERYISVREAGTDAVITVIEVLSPKNKRKGKGRFSYEEKRQQILGSMSHLVEIDLLRGDEPMAMKGVDSISDYRIVVSQHERRPIADLYAFTLREEIPKFLLPLKEPLETIIVDLQSIVSGIYDRGGYVIRIDYKQLVPPPPLSQIDRQWVEELIVSRRNN